MRLSSLEISGFKSFAKSTTITFAPGVTAVVGPNGCGKSNIVDALRWVLGEQRSSVLRGDRMDNVIFNGTVSRKPAGMAEVGIRIDNSGGLLGLAQSEVEIARRLHRDGTSEYLLNGTECRLKDITDLLHDSGMGPNLYSILELKMVEDILREDGEGRRMLFEEAAGIAKYKIRRRQAQQKLRQTEEDLLRLSDILAEVERQVASLKRQALRAKKYNELSAEARNLEIALTYREFRRLQSEMVPLATALKASAATSESVKSAIREQEARIQQLRVNELEIERQTADVKSVLADIVSSISALEAEDSGLRSRMQSSRSTMERVRRERDLISEKRVLLDQRRLETVHNMDSATSNYDQVSQQAVQQAQQVAMLEARMKEIANHAARHAEVLTAKRKFLGNLQREQSALAIQRTSHSSKRDLLRQDSSNCETEREQIHQRLRALLYAQAEADASEQQLRLDERQKQELVRGEEETLSRLDEELRAVTSIADSVSSKRELLKLLESKGPRADAALRKLRTRPVEGLRELLGDTLDVDEKYSRAIHSALGPAAYYFLTENLKSALAAMDYLRREQVGQATFVSLEDLPPDFLPPLNPPEDTYGTALSLLRNSPVERVAAHFLGRFVVVENWHSALKHYDWARANHATLITLEGQWITPQGVLFGGSDFTRNPVDLGLAKQLEELQREHALLQANREKTLELIRNRRVTLAAYQQDLVAIQNRIAQVSAERAQLRETQLTLETRDKTLEERLQADHKLAVELEALIDECDRSLAQVALQVASAQEEVEAEERAEEQFSIGVSEAQRELAAGRQILHSIERERDAARHQQELLAAELHRLDQIQEEMEENLRTAAELEEKSAREMELAEQQSLLVEEQLVARYRERDEAAQAVERMQQKLDEIRNDVNRQEDALRLMRESHAGELDGEKRIELELARLEGELNALVANAKTQLGIDLLEAGFEEVHRDVYGIEATAEKFQECRQRIERLGVVNPLAIDEYQIENTRLQGMLAQRDDLLKAKQTLEETIARINETAQARFLHTFEAVRAGFQQLFQEFFVGGEADLILSGSDLLEADITLWANPSGKRLKSLSLMSGGEKTMTAIALLFALYQVKPSPFCVFDEVDAPLDDANIDRFTRMIRAHSERTQFILVTHNRRTMEIADNLYGVTMEEEGISKLVSVRLLTEVA